MKVNNFTLLFLIMLSFLYTFSQQNSNVYSFQFDGKDYDVVMEMLSWSDAAADAAIKNGHLVHINSPAEDAAIYDAIVNGANIASDYTVVPDGGGIAYVWIGATDKSEEGVWLWDGNNDGNGDDFWNGEGQAGDGDGSAVGDAYINWGGGNPPNEPDNYSNQDAAAIGLSGWPAGSGSLGDPSQWNDINIINTLYYVIEYESNGIGEVENNQPVYYVFPNPFNDELSIEFPAEIENFTLSIFDITGNTIYQQLVENTNSLLLQLSHIPSGIYLLEVKNQMGKRTIQKVQKY